MIRSLKPANKIEVGEITDRKVGHADLTSVPHPVHFWQFSHKFMSVKASRLSFNLSEDFLFSEGLI